jgi:Ca2+-transporting ATPase
MKQNWYAKTVEQIYEAFKTGEQGLFTADAQARALRYGKNSLPDKNPESWFSIFFKQFQSPLIYVLLGVTIILYFTSEPTDAGIILFILVFNSIVGAIQEGRAQATLRALKQFAATQATVIRDGQEMIIDDTEVVPGDLVVLREGEKVPADCRIVHSAGLTMGEAALTGESQPVTKTSDALTHDHAGKGTLLLGDQLNMAFKATHVVSGSGKAIVVATGVTTEIGQISEQIAGDTSEIPLKKNIRNLSKTIIWAVLIMSAVLVVIGLISGQSLKTMLLTVITLAVSVIPEGLPIVMTLVLANGVWRMGKRKALVKKLQAVEALGQAQVIAVDKTGTITKNQLVIQKVYCNNKTFSVAGSGYEPRGDILLNGEAVSPLDAAELVLAGRMAALSANARILWSEDKKEWTISGDPTDAAILVFGEKVGFKQDDLVKRYPLLQEIAFDYKKQYRATVHEHEGHNLLIMIGSPEAIIEHSSFSHGVPPELERTRDAFSEDGLRVIAFAFKEIQGLADPNAIPKLTFGGLFAMKDVLHEEAPEAISNIHEAGINVVMITGDYPATAKALAIEAGIATKTDKVITGYEIDTFSAERLADHVKDAKVFARVTPDHKLRIVRAYQASGKIIAMTGDGVNDAPSLVAADLGVAMGKAGTEVAKEAADIVLLDDNVSTIAAAVEEGRNIYHTIQRVILYLFSTSFGEVLTIAGALMLGFAVPVLPVQILWLNFVTDGFLDVALAMEPKRGRLLTKKFAKPNRYLVSGVMLERIIIMALVMAVGTLLLFSTYADRAPERALTVSLTVLAVFQWFNAWNSRSEYTSLFRMSPFSNMYLVLATMVVVGLQLLAVYTPFFQHILHTVPLTWSDWELVIVMAASIIVVEEVRKVIHRVIEKRRHPAQG